MANVKVDGEDYVPASMVDQIRNMRLADLAAKSPLMRDETEGMLLHRAQLAVSRTNWEVGECAGLWTRRFARGRSDADFGLLCGLSADQVYQRRRVWETFANVYQNYSNLRWGHFYAALNWDDASTCLEWADAVQAGIAEMKAWRRAQRGDDLGHERTEADAV